MSDVIISRRGSSKSNKEILITEYIIHNQNWTVPDYAKNNEFSVRIFGAGGTQIGPNSPLGGGSGWMNNDVFILTPGEIIPITIGEGDKNASAYGSTIHANAGGTTSFGSYLSALGGGGKDDPNGGSGGVYWDYHPKGGCGYQFGGGCSGCNGWGGDGGVYGGGGGGGRNCGGGNGGLYGGGGGGGYDFYTSFSKAAGNGGTYGGGGGVYYGNAGNGGTYGGNGGRGYSNKPSENGTNTVDWINIPDEVRGPAIAGNSYIDINNSYNSYGGGGGGFGGNGGHATAFGPGGGGGYGSNGGNGCSIDNTNVSYALYGGGGGGGGGYLSNGESPNIYAITENGYSYIYNYGNGGGGGGGYGKMAYGFNGMGGGYYCPGGGADGKHGAGGIGIIKDNKLIASYGSGGWHCYYWRNTASFTAVNAEPGVCIIQYYI